ncbi:MAG TPA: ABC transporter permease [Micromonospora sp.]|nr:ABC transporter permease [Micromonospora sp.]
MKRGQAARRNNEGGRDMAYDESRQRQHDAPSVADDDPPDGFPIGYRTGDEVTAVDRPVVLDDVFDDPDHGEPGRDRMAVHAVWEVLLLVAVAALLFLTYRGNPEVLQGAALDSLLVAAAALGLLVLAAGLSLRAGVPNLALGPVAIAAAAYFGSVDRDPKVLIGLVAVAAAALGLALALFVVTFHVPSWAASLAVALAVIVFIGQRAIPTQLPDGWDPTRYSSYFFGGFAAVAVLGGLFGTVKMIRRAVGRFRPVADPARRRGPGAAVVAAGAITVSMMLAALAGVLLAGGSPVLSPSSGIEWTGLALGAALLGGTSAYGRRGGIFGTVLVVMLLALFFTYSVQRGWDLPLGAVAAAMVGGGLVVTRLVEAFGRPRPVTAGGDAEEAAATSSWRGDTVDGEESWSAALPAQPTGGLDSWGGDRWSATGR